MRQSTPGAAVDPYQGGNTADPTADLFTAQITGVVTVAGVNWYQWFEQTIDPATGALVALVYGRTGTYSPTGPTGNSPTQEVNNALVPAGTNVKLKYRGNLNGDLLYDFAAPVSGGSAGGSGTGITILSSTYPIDAKVVQTTDLYTPPAGTVCVVTEVIVRCITATSISAGPTVSVGALTAAFAEIYPSTAMTGLVNAETTVPLAATAFGFCSTGVFGVVPGGFPIKFNLTGAATGTAQILAVETIGYLVIPPATPTPPSTPGPPTGLTFTDGCGGAEGYSSVVDPINNGIAFLSWTAPAGTPPASAYLVYSSTSSSMSSPTFLGSTTLTSWLLTGLNISTLLYYAVKATGGTGGISVYSNTASGTGNIDPSLFDSGFPFGGGPGSPVVSGATTSGSVLSCTTGTGWRGNGLSYTYQWFRDLISDPRPFTAGTPIGGATSSTYTLVSGDVGFGVFCRVTATNTCGAFTATSNSMVGPITSGGGSQTITIGGAGTFTPSFTGTHTIKLTGGGGGGATGAAGGGGGEVAISVVSLTNGVGVPYFNGQGGTPNAAGQDTTWDTSVIVAKGGQPGGGGGTGGIGGTGGTGGTLFDGGAGANTPGGGGSSAGTAANGNNASGVTGGTAPTGGGAGGNAGSPGAAPGGGGGGTQAGATGQILITWP